MSKPPIISVVKKVRFAAAHFLRFPELSDEENLQRFGKSSNPLGHGHNYEVEVTVEGPCNPQTGMVVNLKDIKSILKEEVIEPLDFKNLNLQVDYFQENFTTLENLSQYIWNRLQPRMQALSLTLKGLKVYEADDLYVEYYGGAEATV